MEIQFSGPLDPNAFNPPEKDRLRDERELIILSPAVPPLVIEAPGHATLQHPQSEDQRYAPGDTACFRFRFGSIDTRLDMVCVRADEQWAYFEEVAHGNRAA